MVAGYRIHDFTKGLEADSPPESPSVPGSLAWEAIAVEAANQKKKPHGRSQAQLRKLKLYAGGQHPHEAQQPAPLP